MLDGATRDWQLAFHPSHIRFLQAGNKPGAAAAWPPINRGP